MRRLRQNLFVTGLSADKFPGAPTENYLLLDDEFSGFGENTPTSVNLIRRAQVSLHDLLRAAAALDVRTQLSYSGYDTAELKANNVSSMLYELYLEAGGTDKDVYLASIRKTGYFSQALPGMTAIGQAWQIIDYKTNAERTHLGEKYAAQLAAYAEAVREIVGVEAPARIYHIDA